MNVTDRVADVGTSARRDPVLRISPTGNLGNQMLQYMVALKIQSRVPGLTICGYDMAEWALSAPVPEDYPSDAFFLGGRYVPVDQIVRYMNRHVLSALTVGAVGLRLENLRSAYEDRNAFRPPDGLDFERFGTGFIVINVRGAEVLGDVHPDYGPIPLSFIDQVIRTSGAHPVFLGQLGDDRYSDAIRHRYPDAVFRPSQGALLDFETLRRSSEITVAVSTFSWLAAWFSQAQRVHLPVSGFFNPSQRPDIDLLPIDDDRYIFYDFDVRRWRSTAADFDYLWSARNHALLSRSQLRVRLKDARAIMRRSDFGQRLKFAWQWQGHRALRLIR